MRIEKLVMEDWLAENQLAEFNLAESGTIDFTVGEFLDICRENIDNLKHISLINPDTRGSLELRQQISLCYQQVQPENVLVTVGMSEAIFTFFNIILKPGDEVIVEFPEFQPLYQLPVSLGCQVKFLDLLSCKRFIPGVEQIQSLITPKTKLMIINTPHNPTGSTLDPDTIKEIARIARAQDIYLLFDEHYKFLPLQEGTDLIPSGFDICRHIHDKVAATGSITKCFGLNGLRVGWLIAGADLITTCRDFKDYLTHVTPPISDYLALVALKNKEPLIAFKKASILKNLRTLNTFMQEHEDVFEYIAPTGGVVCFPKLKLDIDAKDFCGKLLETYQVSLLPGFAFSLDQYFRLNFGIDPGKFNKALELIGKMVKEIKNGRNENIRK